jgi:hypothetical protein|nr:MAG TPA: hypothetical protein [Caudoviricetes sp.]
MTITSVKTAQDIVIQSYSIRILSEILKQSSISSAYARKYRGKREKGVRFLYSNSYKTWEAGRRELKTIIRELQRGLSLLQGNTFVNTRSKDICVLTRKYKEITGIKSENFRKESIEEISSVFLLFYIKYKIEKNNMEDFLHFCTPVLSRVNEFFGAELTESFKKHKSYESVIF